MNKFWCYIPDDPIKVFGAYSASVSSNTITNAYDALDYLTSNESGRPTGTVIIVYGLDDIYTFILLSIDWFEFLPYGDGFIGIIFDTHPTHSNHASATVGGTKRNVIVLPMHVAIAGVVTPIVEWYGGYGAPLNGTLYTAPKGNYSGLINYTGNVLENQALYSTSTEGICLDNLSLQGVNDVYEGAFLNYNITTHRDVTITNMVEVPAWPPKWNLINPNTNSYYRIKITKMFHGSNPVFGAIVNGQPVTEIRNGSDLVHRKYYGDNIPPSATYTRGINNTSWTVNSPPDDLFGSSQKKYWYRSSTIYASLSSSPWSSSTTADNSIILTSAVSRWDNHYLETYVQNPTPALSSKSIIVSRTRAENPLSLSISDITSSGAKLSIINSSGYATTGTAINIIQNNGTNTSYNGVISSGTGVNVELTGVNPNTNVTVSVRNILLSGISSGPFTQTISYKTLPTPKTAAPTILGVSCINTSGGSNTNNVRVTVRNNDSTTATIRINNFNHGSLGAGATGTYSFYTGTIPYSYTVSVSATATGKTMSDSVSASGTMTICRLV